MASQITVISTDLRRTTVKVLPGTYMTDVLQEACKKLNLSADKYLLKHKQKQVDLSIVYRQAGLIPGAKLELVQKSNTPSAVSVALQLPAPESNLAPNGRLIEKFASDISLWKVLRHQEATLSNQGKNLNITARGVAQTSDGTQSGSGQLYYETPVLNIMGRELASLSDFQKTLSQLGYNSGSVLIRLSFRKTEQPLFTAMEEIGRFFAETENEQTPPGKPAASAPTETEVPAPADEKAAQPASPTPGSEAPEQPSHTTDSQEASQVSATGDAMDLGPTEPVDPLQPVSIFRAPTSSTPAAANAPISESDYVPSIAHAKLHQARLQSSSQNKRLLSDQELEEQARAGRAKLSAVTSVPVKVRFPDNTSAQWTFDQTVTGATVYQAIRSVMARSDQAFRIVMPGTHTVIKDSDAKNNRLVHDYKITGSVLLNFFWDDGVTDAVRREPFLKGSAAQRATQVKVPETPQGEEEEEERKPAPQAAKPESSSSKGEGGSGKKLPKWLKLPGKK